MIAKPQVVLPPPGPGPMGLGSSGAQLCQNLKAHDKVLRKLGCLNKTHKLGASQCKVIVDLAEKGRVWVVSRDPTLR